MEDCDEENTGWEGFEVVSLKERGCDCLRKSGGL